MPTSSMSSSMITSSLPQEWRRMGLLRRWAISQIFFWVGKT